MGFLNPSALLLFLPLSGAILLLHILRRRRRDLRVPSTLLWELARQDVQANLPWQRLRINPLLLLQLLAAAALCAALAGPHAIRTASTSGDAVVLLDASASMLATDRAPTRFAEAKARVAEIIDRLPPGAALSIVRLGGVAQVLAAQQVDRRALHAALRGAEAGFEEADLLAGLEVARALARPGRPTEVILVSDGRLRGASPGLQPDLPVRFLPVGSPAANRAVAALTLGDRGDVLARVANHGPHDESVTVELRADGALVGSQQVAVSAGGAAEVRWNEPPRGAATLEVRIVGRDALPHDDVAWLALPTDPARVLLVTPGNRFLQEALSLYPYLELDRTVPTPEPLPGYDLTIFDGALPDALPPGNLLLINPPAGNVPFPIGEPTAVGAPRPVSHPLLRYVDLSGVAVSQARLVVPPPGLRPLLAAPEGPLVLAGEWQGRRLAVFSFDLHDSDLPLRPGFPILVHALLDYLLPQARLSQVTPGALIPVQPWPGAVRIRLEGPGGVAETLGAPFPATFGAVARPGLYTVTQQLADGERREHFAVNLFSPLESNLTPLSPLPFATRAADDPLPAAGDGGEPVAAVAPLDLWPWVVLLALLALAAEWWVSYRA